MPIKDAQSSHPRRLGAQGYVGQCSGRIRCCFWGGRPRGRCWAGCVLYRPEGRGVAGVESLRAVALMFHFCEGFCFFGGEHGHGGVWRVLWGDDAPDGPQFYGDVVGL